MGLEADRVVDFKGYIQEDQSVATERGDPWSP
jgi:hypothetical protein